jgi:hypothetical protein
MIRNTIDRIALSNGISPLRNPEEYWDHLCGGL